MENRAGFSTAGDSLRTIEFLWFNYTSWYHFLRRMRWRRRSLPISRLKWRDSSAKLFFMKWISGTLFICREMMAIFPYSPLDFTIKNSSYGHKTYWPNEIRYGRTVQYDGIVHTKKDQFKKKKKEVWGFYGRQINKGLASVWLRLALNK